MGWGLIKARVTMGNKRVGKNIGVLDVLLGPS